jgi:CheY-like chemotaxis protein
VNVRPVVLLVDDEPRILSALRRTLRREGYELLLAGGAADALALLTERSIDLVITDQKMPETTGVEFLREVASRHPAIPRILLTGWPEEIPRVELEALGVRALLPKPWDDAQLKREIRSHLGR